MSSNSTTVQITTEQRERLRVFSAKHGNLTVDATLKNFLDFREDYDKRMAEYTAKYGDFDESSGALDAEALGERMYKRKIVEMGAATGIDPGLIVLRNGKGKEISINA